VSLTFRSTAHSEVGLVRKNNQDSAYVSAGMIMVADGMGGAAAGDLASAVAVAAVGELDADLAGRIAAASETLGDAENPEPGGALLAALADTLDRANHSIADLVAADGRRDGMGTTLCGFVLDAEGAALVNIGDSRAYLLRDGVLTRASRDHSWVQTLVDSGRITEEEALEHPHRSLILRVLNGKPQHDPDLDFVELRPGDRLLVCSDGLCGLVTDAQIAPKAALEDREVAVASLVDLAHEAGGYDNITIILTDVVEGEATDGVQILGSARTQLVPRNEPTSRIPLLRSASRGALSGEDERYALAPRRGSRLGLKVVAGVLVPLLLLAGGAFGWYSYTQTRFYIGPNGSDAGKGQTVAVFRGVPDTILGRPLSQPVVDDGVLLGDLPPLYREKVSSLMTVDSLTAGQTRLAELKVIAARCVTQRAARARATEAPASPAPSPSVTPTGTAVVTAPGASPAPDGAPTTPAASATPSPAPTVPSAPEDC